MDAGTIAKKRLHLGRRALSCASALVVGHLLIASEYASGMCSGLINGPVTVDVLTCRAVAPESQFSSSDERFQWIADLDTANRAKFLNTYRGLLLDAQVVNSKASRGNINGDRGALLGDKVKVFIAPGQSSCATLLSKRVDAQFHEVCCDGGGSAPCLLDTGYTLAGVKVTGVAGAANGKQARGQKAINSQDYKAGEKAIKESNFKEGIKFLEAARQKKELDVRGQYMLAVAYRKADRCKDGISVMRDLFDMNDNPDLWEEERTMVRHGTFLLARCLARVNKAAESVLVLNSYLVEPQRFKTEINQALKDPDFGFIRSSKEYRDFRKLAEKKLRGAE